MTDQEQIRFLVDQATQRFGCVDIVVSITGIIQVGPMSTTTTEDFANALDVMFWGTLYPPLAVLPQMRARRSGRVVNITSIGGVVSVPHLLPYTYAKFAAVGLSKGLRAELGWEGMHVTTVVPGLVHTQPASQYRGVHARVVSRHHGQSIQSDESLASRSRGARAPRVRQGWRCSRALTGLGRTAARHLHQYTPVDAASALSPPEQRHRP